MPMKLLLRISNLLIATLLASCTPSQDNKTEEAKPIIESMQSTQIMDSLYIPENLEDCFKQIDIFLSDSDKYFVRRSTEKEFTYSENTNLRHWIEHKWINPKESRLVKYFDSKKIYPVDICSIILISYHRYLAGNEVRLEEQIKYYQNFWKVSGPPHKSNFPKGVKNLEFNLSFSYLDKVQNNKRGEIFVGTIPNSKTIWLYDYHLGWTKATEEEIEILRQDLVNREENFIKIAKSHKK